MNFPRIRSQHKIRVNYKSGNSVEAWFWGFKVTGTTYKWLAVSGYHPLKFGADIDQIESIWQVGYRRWQLYLDDPKFLKDFNK